MQQNSSKTQAKISLAEFCSKLTVDQDPSSLVMETSNKLKAWSFITENIFLLLNKKLTL